MAEPQCLRILAQGRDAWNAWRRDRTSYDPDLSDADLAGVDLSGVDLRGAKLSGADLSGADCRACLFGAWLFAANLNKAVLRGAQFGEATVTGADLTEADLSDAVIEKSNFSSRPALDIAGLRIYEASNSANFTNAKLVRARASHAQFEDVNFLGAQLNFAILRNTNLRGANLCGADLSDTDLTSADLTNCRLDHRSVFRGAGMVEACLQSVDFSGVTLSKANLKNQSLRNSKLAHVDLSGANLQSADLRGADLSSANLDGADLRAANLSDANLCRATCKDAQFDRATLIDTCLDGVDLTGASVFGVSVWNVSLKGTIQRNLLIRRAFDDAPLTLDNLEVAQFIYLLLNNARIREVIDTITSKAVLILGRFTPERKATLDAIPDALRNRNYLPILFDFEKPTNRDFTETVLTLASLARFVIADLTDPRSIPQELMAIIPLLQSVPVRPLLLGDQREWGMFRDLSRRPQVIEPFHYSDDRMLVCNLDGEVIEPAEQRARQLAGN